VRPSGQEAGLGLLLLDAAGVGVEAGGNAAVAGPKTAVSAGAVAFGGKLLLDLWSRHNAGKELEAKDKRFLEENSIRLNGHFKAALARAEIVAEKKGIDFNWPKNEAPTFKEGSLGKIAVLYEERKKDPFILLRKSANLPSELTAEERWRWSQLCVKAAESVPEEKELDTCRKEFDKYRAAFLMQAAHLADSASLQELHANGWVYPAPTGAEAVRLFRAARSYIDESKVTDRLRYRQGFSLLSAGCVSEGRLEMEKANSLHKTPQFAYDYACALARDGKPKRALEWLQWSFFIGRERTGWEDQDPDLDSVRMAYPEEFRKVVGSTQFVGAMAPGPWFHADDKKGKYDLGLTKIQFYFATLKLDPEAGKTVPPDAAVEKIAEELIGKFHSANTAYYYTLLEPGTLMVLKHHNETSRGHGWTSVYRHPNGTWFARINASGWKEVGKGEAAGYQFNGYPGYEIHHDIIRPKSMNADRADREVNYRFRVVQK